MLSEQVSMTIVVAGLLSGAVVAAAGRAPREGLRCALDFFVAAGLVRLVGPATWTTLLATAAIIALRQLAGRGLRGAAGARASAPADVRTGGAQPG